jgi:hypothetical protein
MEIIILTESNGFETKSRIFVKHIVKYNLEESTIRDLTKLNKNKKQRTEILLSTDKTILVEETPEEIDKLIVKLKNN